MKKILFMLDYYLPNASPNGICVSRIAKEMVSAGWDVSVLCFGSESLDSIEIDNDVEIFRCCEYETKSKHSLGYSIKFYFKWLMPSKYPITERKKITNTFYEVANKLYERKHFDIIVAVHLPIETIIAGTKLKKQHPEIILISYMLDSLSGGFVPRLLPEKYLRNKKLAWENCLFSNYDKIILMESSRKHHEKNSYKQNWYERSVFLDIPLLTDILEPNKTQNKNKRSIIIAFCGLLNYPYRNVRFILSIIKHMDTRFKFVFAGKSNIEDELLNNDERIEYLGQIPHSDVESLLDKADILLNLGVRVPSAISGKIFEYMSYGKPIVSTFSIDDEACIPYLKKYPLSFLIDERNKNVVEHAKSLQCFIDNNVNKRVSYNLIYNNFYNNTPNAFINTLEKMIST